MMMVTERKVEEDNSMVVVEMMEERGEEGTIICWRDEGKEVGEREGKGRYVLLSS